MASSPLGTRSCDCCESYCSSEKSLVVFHDWKSILTRPFASFALQDSTGPMEEPGDILLIDRAVDTGRDSDRQSFPPMGDAKFWAHGLVSRVAKSGSSVVLGKLPWPGDSGAFDSYNERSIERRNRGNAECYFLLRPELAVQFRVRHNEYAFRPKTPRGSRRRGTVCSSIA